MLVIPIAKLEFHLNLSDEAEVEKQFNAVKDRVRDLFLQDKQLFCHLVEIHTGDTMYVAALKYDGALEKDEAADAITELTKTTHARMVIQVVEAWTTTHRTPEEAEAAHAKYRSLADAPDREEAIFVMLEHPTFGQRASRAIISRSGEDVSLGDWHDSPWHKATGRFSGYLRHLS